MSHSKRIVGILALALVVVACRSEDDSSSGRADSVSNPTATAVPSTGSAGVPSGDSDDLPLTASDIDTMFNPAWGLKVIESVAVVTSPVGAAFLDATSCTFLPRSHLPLLKKVVVANAVGTPWSYMPDLLEPSLRADRSVYGCDFGQQGGSRSLSIIDNGEGSIIGGIALGGEEWDLTWPGSAALNVPAVDMLLVYEDTQGDLDYRSYTHDKLQGPTPFSDRGIENWGAELPIQDAGIAFLATATYQGTAVENFSSRQAEFEVEIIYLVVSANVADAIGANRLAAEVLADHLRWEPDPERPGPDPQPVVGFDPDRLAQAVAESQAQEAATSATEAAKKQAKCNIIQEMGTIDFDALDC